MSDILPAPYLVFSTWSTDSGNTRHIARNIQASSSYGFLNVAWCGATGGADSIELDVIGSVGCIGCLGAVAKRVLEVHPEEGT